MNLSKKLLLQITLITTLSLGFLTACVSQLGVGWSAITVLDDGVTAIVAFEGIAEKIDLRTGDALTAVDNEGQNQLDKDGNVILWQVNGRSLDNAQFFSQPLQLNDNLLLLPAVDLRLFQVNLATGEILTDVPPFTMGGSGKLISQPVRLDESTVLLGAPHSFVSLDISSEADQGVQLSQNWEVDTVHSVWSAAVVVEDHAYFTSLDHQLYAVMTETGEVSWTIDLGGAATATPIYDAENQRLYVASLSGNVYAVSLEGDILSSFRTKDWVWGTPTLKDAILYVPDLAGNVYALDTNDELALLWRSEAVIADGIRTTPIVLDEFVIVGSRDKKLYWLDRETGLLSSRVNQNPIQLDGEVLSNMLYLEEDQALDIEQDLLIVSTLSKRELVVGFNAKTGERLWTHRR